MSSLETRHPLQELTVPSYIANDTTLVGGHDGAMTDVLEQSPSKATATTDHVDQGPNMTIVTGPNYSGKSVYLKQVALIVFLAHVGRQVSRIIVTVQCTDERPFSFVPADSAKIGITDKILTRIATRESVSKVSPPENCE